MDNIPEGDWWVNFQTISLFFFGYFDATFKKDKIFSSVVFLKENNVSGEI